MRSTTFGTRAPRYAAALAIVAVLGAVAPARGAAVTVTEDANAYVLSNGTVTARVDKRSGALSSLNYNGTETLNPGGRGSGFWSHSAASPNTVASVTIDPKTTSGGRAEVAVKGSSGGQRMGSGPGGSAVADIECRYSLARDDAAVYLYTIWTHRADYPATSVGEARFCAKLNDAVFDWMTVDSRRNLKMLSAQDWNGGTPMNNKESRLMNTGPLKGQVEHKYDYSANQFDTPVWGWSSTTKNVGIWFVNPSVEYLSSGPTKIELSAHRDATFNVGPEHLNDPAPPCLLNYWRSSHYGGSELVVAQGEEWTKVVGPFLIYCNAGPTPDAMWKDALARGTKEAAAWPYDWVKGVDYPHRDGRGTVTGRLALDDGGASGETKKNPKLPHLLVGLAAAPYAVTLPPSTRTGNTGAGGGGRGGPVRVSWSNDAKHYEFWTRGGEDGQFTIPNVRPGTYTLYAIADGVLGEFAKADVTVAAGGKLDLGSIDWKPVRHGRQLWDVGTPNRTASEFRHGDNYYHWGLYNQYPKEFPDDVHYTVGKSDPRKDWNYAQLPRATDDVGKAPGTATTWTVHFDLPAAPAGGTATLRLAVCGSGGTTVAVGVNGKPVGDTGKIPYNSTIIRDAIQGSWGEYDVTFDATAMKAGENQLTLSIPAGGVSVGVEYDYVRLELDEATKFDPTPAGRAATPTPAAAGPAGAAN